MQAYVSIEWYTIHLSFETKQLYQLYVYVAVVCINMFLIMIEY